MSTARPDLPAQPAPERRDGHAVRRIDDLPQLWDGFAKLVRTGPGISAFRAQIMDLPVDADHLVRVDAGVARTLSSGPDGLRVPCIGSVPGGVYTPPAWSQPIDEESEATR